MEPTCDQTGVLELLEVLGTIYITCPPTLFILRNQDIKKYF